MRPWRTFGRDQRGVSAVEFALIAPLMLVFYFGLTELCQAMLAERRANHVASAVGDLITQREEISVTEINDVFKIGALVLAPFPEADLTVKITHVTADPKGKPFVDWSRGYRATPDGPNTAKTLPLVINPNDSLLVTEVTYKYTSPFGYFVPKGITFNEKSYLRPRRSAKVTCTNNCT
jgi:Flp pilus assembly protein TadG